MLKKETHIAKVRRLYESNQRFILMATGLTEYRYSEIIFESGIMFLEESYPRQTEFEYFYKFVAYDRDFWHWWIAEWKYHENEMVQFFKPFKPTFKEKFYLEEMLQIVHDQQTEYKFYANYQKPKFTRATSSDMLREPVA